MLGPHDNIDAVLRYLTRAADEGSYHYLRLMGDRFDEENALDNEDIDFTSPAELLDELDFDMATP